MYRRDFLKIFPTLSAMGCSLTHPGVSSGSSLIHRNANTTFYWTNHPVDEDAHELNVQGACFDSGLCGESNGLACCRDVWLPQRHRDCPVVSPGLSFPNRPWKLHTGAVRKYPIEATDQLIVIANPWDWRSWSKALNFCHKAKAKGVLTILLVARAPADFANETSIDTMTRIALRDGVECADIVIPVATNNIYVTLANVLFLFTNYGHLIGVDFADIRMVLSSASEGHMFSHKAQGPTRAHRVAQRIRGQIETVIAAGRAIKGVLTIMEVDATLELAEMHSVTETVENVAPKEAIYMVACVGPYVAECFKVTTILAISPFEDA